MAIAFDSYSEGAAAGSVCTVSHTCAGSNLILIVSARASPSTNTVTGVTYNGVAMTQIATITVDANDKEYLFYLLNPSTGTHDIVATQTGSNSVVTAASYTGAKQSGQPDNSGTNSGSGTTMTQTLTPVASNCWMVTFFDSTVSVVTQSTNTTLRGGSPSTFSKTLGDTNGTISGATSMSATHSSGAWGTVGVTIAPAVASGPTTVKILNGIAAASIKTWNGISWANVKSWNGMT